MKERSVKVSQGCRRPKRRKRSLIRKVRPIAKMTLKLLLNQAGGWPSALDRRCVADIAKCLKRSARWGRDENMVKEALTGHGAGQGSWFSRPCSILERGRFDPMTFAAGADDQ